MGVGLLAKWMPVDRFSTLGDVTLNTAPRLNLVGARRTSCGAKRPIAILEKLRWATCERELQTR
jgi:hypothetical protein